MRDSDPQKWKRIHSPPVIMTLVTETSWLTVATWSHTLIVFPSPGWARRRSSLPRSATWSARCATPTLTLTANSILTASRGRGHSSWCSSRYCTVQVKAFCRLYLEITVIRFFVILMDDFRFIFHVTKFSLFWYTIFYPFLVSLLHIFLVIDTGTSFVLFSLLLISLSSYCPCFTDFSIILFS